MNWQANLEPVIVALIAINVPILVNQLTTTEMALRPFWFRGRLTIKFMDILSHLLFVQGI